MVDEFIFVTIFAKKQKFRQKPMSVKLPIHGLHSYLVDPWIFKFDPFRVYAPYFLVYSANSGVSFGI
jgi:hypothetical protein